LTVSALGAASTKHLDTRAFTCTGSGVIGISGTQCFVPGPVNSDVTATASVDGPLLRGEELQLDYTREVVDPPPPGCDPAVISCTVARSTTSRTISATVHTGGGGTPSLTASIFVNGILSNSVTLYIGL
jgi:hypothetical protein